MVDEQGPITIAHYEAKEDEVVTIATRDDVEHQGNAGKMLEALLAKFPTLKVRPVTRGGTALAKKFGFKPMAADDSLWSREN